jgi:pyruvate-formate lyase
MGDDPAALPAPVREARVLEALLCRATIELPAEGRLIGTLGLSGDVAAQAVALGSPAPTSPSDDAAQMRARFFCFGEYTPAHTTINHPLILQDGLGGVMRRVAEALPTATPAGRETLTGMALALEAVCQWAERHGNVAAAQAETTGGPERERLAQIAAVCRRVPRHPAGSFHEALQAILFVRVATGLSERCHASLSLGRLDQDLLPLYRQDLERGVPAAELEELLGDFVTQLNRYGDAACAANLGGLDAAGCDQCNELTDVILRTAVRLHLPGPLLAVHVHPDMPPEVLDAVTQPALLEMGQPTYYGEHACREALRRRGVPEADLPGWAANSCMGLMVPGEEISDMWAAAVNAPLALELATNGGKPYRGEMPLALAVPAGPEPTNYGELRARFLAYFEALLEWALARNAAATAWVAAHWPNPFLSALIGDCVERGLDRAGGGARYHVVTVEAMGLVNVADALTAVRRLVDEQGRYTLAEIVAAAREDFAGREDLRRELLAQPKFGNGDAAADEMLRELAEHFAACVARHSQGNRHYGPSFHTLTAHLAAGANLGGGLDGRRAGAPVAKNVGTSPGLALQGHTKLMLSATAFDQRDFFGGQALDLSLPAASLRTPEDRRKFQALLLTYFARGGLEVQVNGVTADELRAAIADPGSHRDLTVRIAGYSARFVGLSPAVQQEMVARFEAGL